MTKTYLKDYLDKNGQINLDTKVCKIYKKGNIWVLDIVKDKIKKSISCKIFFYAVVH